VACKSIGVIDVVVGASSRQTSLLLSVLVNSLFIRLFQRRWRHRRYTAAVVAAAAAMWLVSDNLPECRLHRYLGLVTDVRSYIATVCSVVARASVVHTAIHDDVR